MSTVFALDPMLGRVMRPGHHGVQGIPFTVEEDGGRTTGPAEADARPLVWIFGCSWTFGSGEPDETVFPYLLQQRLPRMRIRSFGLPGYGTIHNLLDLRRRTATARPDHVVFVYGDFHMKRNVPNLERFRKFSVGEHRSVRHHPRARLDRHGRLSIDIIEFLPEHAQVKLGTMDRRIVDPDEFTLVQATFRIIEAAAAQCRQVGAGFTLANLTRPADPVLDATRKAGIPGLDLSPVLYEAPPEQRWNDAKHPNAALHAGYAALLAPLLETVRARPEAA